MQLTYSPGFNTPTIEDRVTTATEPGYSGDQAELNYAYWFLGLSEQWRTEHLGPLTAFTFAPYWACINAITHSLCSIGWHSFTRNGETSEQVPLEDPVSWTLEMQANDEMSAIDWREVMLKDALDGGNGYAEIETDGFGRFQQVWHIANTRICPERTDSGKLIYEVSNGSGVKNTILDPSKVFHLKGIGSDGLVGWSIRDFAKRAIKLGIDEEKFGANFFSRGPTPGGVLELGGALRTPEQMSSYRREFEKAYSGQQNSGRVLVVSGNMKFNPYSLANREAQFSESRVFQGLEMCRFFRVPPHKIFDLTHATFSNIEEQNIEFVTDCLLYWAKKLESQADLKFYGRTNRGKRYTRLNLSSLIRGNMMAQTEAITKQLNAGALTPNEARRFWDRNPYPAGLGDEPLVQGAMIALDDIENPPEPPAPPIPGAPAPNGQPPQPGQPAKEEPPTDVAETFIDLIAHAYHRLANVRIDKAERAKSQGKLKEHLDSFYGDFEPIEKMLGPLFISYAHAMGKPVPTTQAIAERARNYAGLARDCVAARGPDALKHLDRVALAQQDIAFLWNGGLHAEPR